MPLQLSVKPLRRLLAKTLASTLCLTATFCLPAQLGSAADNASWSQWRGNGQNGVAPGKGFPLKWTDSEGVKWKVEVPGSGGSTPVIAGNKAFLTTGLDGKNHVQAWNVDTGELIWSTSVGDDAGGKHRKGSGANPSAVTDGKSVVTYFRSGDLACLGTEGKIKWQVNLQKEFGEDTLWWDLGSSPTLINNLVVVAVMQSGPSYLVAYDRETGKMAWKVDRKTPAPSEAAQSYSTPVAIPEKNQIAVMGADTLTIHSAKDGSELGRVGGFNPTENGYFRSISSPVVSGDIVICPYSRGDTVTACRISDVIAGKGRDSILWHREKFGSDVATPAVLDGRVYVCGDSKATRGRITAVDLESGETIWETKTPKSRQGFSSSPLIADNHLFFIDEGAVTYVVGPLDAEAPEVVSQNEIDDDEAFTVASPVPVGDRDLLVRTKNMLYRIGR